MKDDTKLPEKIYHYTSFQKFLSIWDSKELWFTSHKDVNDMMERSKMIVGYSKECLDYFYNYMECYDQISFCMDYENEGMHGYESPAMWGLYGMNGVCIEIDTSKLSISDRIDRRRMNYEQMVFFSPIKLDVSMDRRKEIEEYVNKNIEQLFFTKHIHWAFENEFRMIQFNPSKYSDQSIVRNEEKLKLNIKDAISAIYITNLSRAERHALLKIVRKETKVYYYGVKPSERHPCGTPNENRKIWNLSTYGKILDNLEFDPGYYSDKDRIRKVFSDKEDYKIVETYNQKQFNDAF